MTGPTKYDDMDWHEGSAAEAGQPRSSAMPSPWRHDRPGRVIMHIVIKLAFEEAQGVAHAR